MQSRHELQRPLDLATDFAPTESLGDQEQHELRETSPEPRLVSCSPTLSAAVHGGGTGRKGVERERERASGDSQGCSDEVSRIECN